MEKRRATYPSPYSQTLPVQIEKKGKHYRMCEHSPDTSIKDKISSFKRNVGNNFIKWEKKVYDSEFSKLKLNMAKGTPIISKEVKNLPLHSDIQYRIQGNTETMEEVLNGYIKSKKKLHVGEMYIPSIEGEFKSSVTKTSIEYGIISPSKKE
jgi:hypothetical protein